MSVEDHELSCDGNKRMFSDDMFVDNKVYNKCGVFIGEMRRNYRFGDKLVYFRDDGLYEDKDKKLKKFPPQMILRQEGLSDSEYYDPYKMVKDLPNVKFENGEIVRGNNRDYPYVSPIPDLTHFQKNKRVLKNKRVSKSNRKRAPPKRIR